MLRDLFLRLWLLICCLAAIACAQPFATPGDPLAIVRSEYLRAYNHHDADAVLALYADDAVLLSDAGVFSGKSAIRKWLQFAFDQGSKLQAIVATREKFSGALAYGTGHTRRLAGTEIHLGRYLLVLEKRDGKWVIIEHASLNAHD